MLRRTRITKRTRRDVYKRQEDLEGDYVAILHGDDKWNEKKLEAQVAVLDSRPEVAACFTGVTVIDDDGNAYVGNHAYANVFSMENKSRYEWLRYFLSLIHI